MEMDDITRRNMLKYLLAGSAAGLISACQKSPAAAPASPSNPTVVPTQTAATGAPAVPTATQPQPTAASYPDLAVARTGEPEALTRAALDALGGMSRFVPKGSKVIVKPNICVAYHTYEYAATTNPWVVGAIVKMCLEAGARTVQVMDYPFGGTAKAAYAKSGIAEQVEAAGGEMVQMSPIKFNEHTIDNALSLTRSFLYDDALTTDVLIDVPIAKNHSMATLTMGMKNLMGLIMTREEIHWDFGKRLTDLARVFHPTLTVIDAVRILTANGPTGGNLADVKQLDTVIASADIVAADSYGATLFGMKPEDLDYIQVGAENGLGRSDLANMNIKEITVGA
jgi:uncharacterized protein (DUF362 family)